jgi:acyl carrier protein
MEKSIFKDNVQKFLLSDVSNSESQVLKIDYGTNLWDVGLVDSFRIMELILFLEDLTGTEISVESNSITNFHTIDSMYNSLDLNQK